MSKQKSQEERKLRSEEIKCRFCEQSFNSMDRLEDHINEAHSDEYEHEEVAEIWSRSS